MSPFITIAIIAVAAITAAALKKPKDILGSAWVLALLGGVSVFAYTVPVIFNPAARWSDDLWLLDGFSALIATMVAFVYIAATIVGVRYIGHEFEEGVVNAKDLKTYFSLIHVFALSMLIAVMANNALLLWIALESTTLSSTFLVGLYRKKTSIEAAWKYIIICSTGITLGLIGILLLGYGSVVAGIKGSDIFLISALANNAHLISADIVRWAFVFIFIGFGAKVGLAPMHTWLPDAHSKAPSPISAMFSGVLLNVALYAVIRFKFITDSAMGHSDWTNGLLLFFGALSIIIPAFMMLVQNNYKRMLAYSSVEHMGLITFALALPPIGAIAALIHMVGHTLTKSALFFGAGEILLEWKTTKTEKVRGLLKYAPYTAILFLLGILAIIALPPSALFVSEYTMFVNAFALHPVVSLLVFAALSTIAFSMLRSTISMFASGKEENVPTEMKQKWNITHSVIALQLALLVIFGFWVSTDQGINLINSIAKDAIYISQK
ncbi:MAG TPA: proton-conducting transporter membrane subunit [Patescibacteria group bacterium]